MFTTLPAASALTPATDDSTPTRLAAVDVTHRIRLRDGTVLEVRPTHPGDGDRLQRFHARLSPTTIALRYFHLMTRLPDALVASFTHLDSLNHMALVATHESAAPPPPSIPTSPRAPAVVAEEIVSLANYDRVSADTAEVAFVVEDVWQGQGIASILLYDLAAYAHAYGFSRLLAILLYHNSAMLAVLRHCGFPCQMRDQGDDEIYVWLDITAPPRCRCAPLAR